MRKFPLYLASFIVAAASAYAPAEAAPPPTVANSLVHAGYLTFAVSYADPPQDFLKSGKPTGFDIDIAKALANELGLKARFVDFSFQGIFPALIAHKVDAAISGIGITPQREKVYDYVPYFIGGQRMLAANSFPTTFKTDLGLCGYHVATVEGSVEYGDLTHWSAKCPDGKKISISVYPSFSEDLEQLAKGSVQVIDIDWPVSAYFLQKFPKRFKAVSPIVSGLGPDTPPNREGILLRKDEVPLQTALTGALKKLQTSGEYTKLLAKWNLDPGDIRDYGKFASKSAT